MALTLLSVAGRLRSLTSAPKLIDDHGGRITCSPVEMEGYIQPTFTEESWPGTARVLLIEAPGAVGKSAAAESMAAKLNWPLVRSQFGRVGSHSLSGLVQDALGFSENYAGKLAEGTAGIVIDSLDEARLRAGTQNFLEFVNNIQNLTRAPVASDVNLTPSIVLFSRADTAEIVKLAFLGADLPLATLSIDFFDFAKSQEFIKAYMKGRFALTRRPEYNAPLASPRPFSALCRARFLQVMRILLGSASATLENDWDRSKDFLGYAPVLIAIAEALATKNPSAETSRLDDLKANSESDLLDEIIHRILSREQDKFEDLVTGRLHSELPIATDAVISPRSLYQPTEQVVRLAAFVYDHALAAALPASLPSVVRESYESSVDEFLSDHPFLKGRDFASQVFSDYVQAQSAMTFEGRSALIPELVPSLPTVGPFLYLFVRNMVDEAVERSIPEHMVEPLLVSWAQECRLRSADSDLAFVILFENFGSLHFFKKHQAVSSTQLESDSFDCVISEMSGAFHLHRGIDRLILNSDQGVILGEANEDFIFGSSSVITADEISCQAHVVGVAPGIAEGVVIVVNQLEANSLRRVDAKPKDLLISSPKQVPALLQGFAQKIAWQANVIPTEYFVALRAILTFFRSTVHMGLTTAAERMQQVVLKENVVRHQVFDELTARHVISVSGSWLVLKAEMLSSLGFGLDDIKSGTPSDPIKAFLASVVDRHNGGPKPT